MHPTLPEHDLVLVVGGKEERISAYPLRSTFSDGDNLVSLAILRALTGLGVKDLIFESQIIFESFDSGKFEKKAYVITGSFPSITTPKFYPGRCLANFLGRREPASSANYWAAHFRSLFK